MYIAVVQSNPIVGDIAGNAKRALAQVDALADQAYPPDLVIFPSYALSGFPIDGLQMSDAFAAECLSVAYNFIAAAKLPVLAGTMIPRPLEDGFGFSSEAEAIYSKDGSGGALGFVDVHNEWSTDSYASSITVMIDGYTVSVVLDEYPESADDLTASDIIIMMLSKEYRGTNTMFTASMQTNYLKRLASKNRAWVVVANLVGAQDSTVFDGASLIVDPSGEVVCAAPAFEEAVLNYNINLQLPRAALSKNPVSQSVSLALDTKPADASSDKVVGVDEVPNGKLKRDDCSQKNILEAEPSKVLAVNPLLPYEADWKAICLFVVDYVRKNNFRDVIVGMSGGIDSAVVAAIAYDALGADHVYGLIMPGSYSSPSSASDAYEQAQILGIKTFELPISDVLERFEEVFTAGIKSDASALAKQNIQARMRTAFLMHMSNTFGYLMLNTTNKSERAMGYSTLYGDTAGAISPLGNIYKTDVYGLANWRNERSLVIPESSITKAPSAELYAGQTDQETLPPYDVLDHILQMHIEEGLGIDQIMEFTARSAFGEPVSSELVKRILTTVQNAEFKRRQEPLAPSLGYTDMNVDRNWPITNGFADHEHLVDPKLDIFGYLNMIRSWKMPEGWDFLAN